LKEKLSTWRNFFSTRNWCCYGSQTHIPCAIATSSSSSSHMCGSLKWRGRKRWCWYGSATRGGRRRWESVALAGVVPRVENKRKPWRGV